MNYYYNYEADVVVREDEDKKRYLKTLDDPREISAGKETKSAWGIPSYGYYNMLFPITKEQYDSYGITWFEMIPS